MRVALQAITEELKRLRSHGVKDVSVSDETLAALRLAVRRGRPDAAVLPPASAQRENASVRAETSQATGRSEMILAVAEATALEPAPISEKKLRAPQKSEKPLVSQDDAFPVPPTVTLPSGGKSERWEALLLQMQSDPVCRAHVRPGKKLVLGVGSLDAKIFFCGEAPGADEEEQGEPFVGPAGQLLTRMIQGMGLSRSEVYIGNIMNWRPELPVSGDGIQVGNRAPTAAEMAYCLPYLKAQIEIVNPELIVALGSTATQGLLGAGTFKTLGEIRSQWKLFAGKPVMVTYHPSYILRNPTNRSKRAIWEDLLKVMERAALPISEKQRSFFLDK